jgi:hypothetical protein
MRLRVRPGLRAPAPARCAVAKPRQSLARVVMSALAATADPKRGVLRSQHPCRGEPVPQCPQITLINADYAWLDQCNRHRHTWRNLCNQRTIHSYLVRQQLLVLDDAI